MSEKIEKFLPDILVRNTPKIPDKQTFDIVEYDKVKSNDPLTSYLREISRYPLLSKEQENELLKSFKESGDIDIAKKLVLHNLRLVVKISFEYRHAYQNIMDLIQEGNIGLMKAVSKFDNTKGAKLSYYASWWIKSYILKFLLDNFRLVKIGTTNEQKKLFYNLLKEKDRLEKLGIIPDHKTIAQELNVSEKSVALMDRRLSPSGTELSLDYRRESDNGEDDVTLLDGLVDDRISTENFIEQRLDSKLLKKHLLGFLEELNERDKEIFTDRLLSDVTPSLQEIGNRYRISRERVRQIEARLLKRLRVYMAEFIR